VEQNSFIFKQRIIGRVLAKSVYSLDDELIAYRNQDIPPDLAAKIVKHTTEVYVRSPLTCKVKQRYVCQLCYGWSLAHSQLVPSGEAVELLLLNLLVNREPVNYERFIQGSFQELFLMKLERLLKGRFL
jgi:hypothetical protein